MHGRLDGTPTSDPDRWGLHTSFALPNDLTRDNPEIELTLPDECKKTTPPNSKIEGAKSSKVRAAQTTTIRGSKYIYPNLDFPSP